MPALSGRVGPLLKNLRPEASEALRLAEARVLRVLEALRSSFVCILRVWEAHGRVGCLTNLRPHVGPLKKDLKSVSGSELGSYELRSELGSYEFK